MELAVVVVSCMSRVTAFPTKLRVTCPPSNDTDQTAQMCRLIRLIASCSVVAKQYRSFLRDTTEVLFRMCGHADGSEFSLGAHALVGNSMSSSLCILTLVLLNPDIPCLCKQCRSRSVGFFRSQLIWICSVCHKVYEFIATNQIKQSDWLKIRSGCVIFIYSAGQGLNV